MTTRDVERFDRRAAGYEREWLQSRFHGPVRRTTLGLAASFEPTPRAVLDVGCGTGALLRLARDRFPAARLVGIDPSPRMLTHADAGDAELVVARAETLPFADGSFDLVFSTLSLHHWDDLRAGVLELARVVAPGGVVVLSDRLLPRLEPLVGAVGLLDLGRWPIYSVGPLTIVTAQIARAATRPAASTCVRQRGTRRPWPRPRDRSCRDRRG